MRIKTQFILTVALFGIVLVAIGASVIVTGQQVGAATEQEKVATSIAQAANELGYFANDYLIYRESQQRSRWQARFASFSTDVSALRVGKPEQQVLVRNIQASQRRMKEVFDSIASPVGSSGNQGAAFDPTFLQVSWSRMAVQSQGLVSDASRLSRLLREQADEARQTNTIVVLGMMGVFAAYFLVNFRIVQQRLLQSIAALKLGTLVIGSGDLDHAIEERKNDEIGDLSRAFNRMAANLKLVTASKTDLEREITERKLAEAERERLLQQLQMKNEELRAQSEELQSANEELQAQSEELEAANEELQAQSAELEAANEELHIANNDLAHATAIAEAAVRARDEFLAVAAHELKTPVTSLRGFAQVLLRGHEKGGAIDPVRLSQALGTIDRQSDKLARLVTTLLDISRLEGGQFALERRQTDIVNLVEEMAVAARLKSSRHEITVEAPGRVEAFIDPLRMEQVIANLLDNAMRYSPDGGPIQISVGGGERFEIAVRDRGIGIPPEHREHVFERFYRGDSGSHISGLGLGLYISKQIVELHGGRIEVDCPSDGGTRFTVSLPADGRMAN